MTNYTKFTTRYFFLHLLTDLFAAAFLAWNVYGILAEEYEISEITQLTPYVLWGTLLVYLGMVCYHGLYLHHSGYALEKSEMRCRRGVFFRKESVLEYRRMHAINQKQNLLHRLFDIAVLTVDSGSANTAFQAEITVIERTDKVEELMRELRARQNGEEGEATDADPQAATAAQPPEENLYRFTSERKLVYTLLTTLSGLVGLLLFGAIACAALAFILPHLTWDSSLSPLDWIRLILLGALACLICVAFLSFLGGMLTSFVGYYDFRVFRSGDNLEIRYGLLDKHSNTFCVHRVRAVRIRQTLMQRWFHFASVRLEVVGYGEVSGEDAQRSQIGMLLPLCPCSEIPATLRQLLPDYVPSEKKVQTKSFPALFLWRWLALGITLCALTFLATGILWLCAAPASVYLLTLQIAGGVLAVSLLLTLLREAFAYRANGLSLTGDQIIVFSGAFHREQTILLRKNLVAIEEISTPLRRRRGISSYVLHFYSNAATNTVGVRCLPSEQTEALRAMLED